MTPTSTIIDIAAAIERVMASPAWAAALGDDEERTYLIIEGLCAELHPRGSLTFPSPAMLRQSADRGDRNERIRREFDGRNYEALARRHGLSARQVRRILDRKSPAS